jgi:AcrR family transcriptional regulator
VSKPSQRRPVAGRPRSPAVDEAILRAAFDLFIEHGVEGANFEQIARRSGVSRATIYRRWNRKEDLLACALRRARNSRFDNPDQLLALSPRDLLDELREIFVETLTRPEFPKFVARLIGSVPSHPELMRVYREDFVQPFCSAIDQVLESARRTGELSRTPEKDILYELLSGAMTQRLLLRSGRPNLKDERRWVDTLMRSLGLEIKSSIGHVRPNRSVSPAT